MLYFDTNALLPYYREEQASVCVQQRLCAQSQPVLISLVGWARGAHPTELGVAHCPLGDRVGNWGETNHNIHHSSAFPAD